MDEGEEKLVTNVVLIGAAFFLVVKPIMSKLGIDPADQNLIDDVSTAPAASNPFSINYPYSLYGSSPNAYGNTFYNNLKALWIQQGSSNTYTQNLTDIVINGEILLDSFGYILLNSGNVAGVFNSLKYKGDVSDIAAYLNFVYSIDLWTLLNNGKKLVEFIGGSGLSGSDVANIVRRVSSLPDNPIYGN